jgi:DNA-directed RNA polymerase specialized sigma24 family protein
MNTKKDEDVMPFKEMSEKLGISEKTAYAHNRDALKKFKDKLERLGFKKEDFFGGEK